MKTLIEETLKLQGITPFKEIYAVTIYGDSVRLQGYYTKELKHKFEQLGFEFKNFKRERWYEAVTENTVVTLTY